MELTIKKITSPDTKFWEAFDVLAEKTCDFTVHLNSVWLSNYIEYYLTNKQSVFILAAYSDGKLIGCLPLQTTRKRATKYYDFTELEILGFGPTDFYDIPVEEKNRGEILSQLVSYLLKDHSWDKLNLSSIPEDSKSLKALLEVFTQQEIHYEIDAPNGYAYIETEGDWDHFFETKFNPKNKDLAKSERRIDAQGFELKYTSYRKNIYQELLKNIDLYAQRRESLGQFNKYETDNLKKFLQNIITVFESKNKVELTVLEVNDETWAFQLDWISNKTRYHWNHAYNEDYKRYSPGKLILKKLLENSFHDPDIHYCNHMRGLSSYKEKFTESQRMLMRVRMDHPKSIKIKLTRFISKTLRTVRR